MIKGVKLRFLSYTPQKPGVVQVRDKDPTVDNKWSNTYR